MPRLTRNSRESGPVFSGIVSSEQSSSESRTSIGATSGASTTTNTVVQSVTSTMPTLSTGDIVTNVVQVLQGQLTSIVQNAIDAQLLRRQVVVQAQIARYRRRHNSLQPHPLQRPSCRTLRPVRGIFRLWVQRHFDRRLRVRQVPACHVW
jgi:predicted amino acid dehydrogenase